MNRQKKLGIIILNIVLLGLTSSQVCTPQDRLYRKYKRGLFNSVGKGHLVSDSVFVPNFMGKPDPGTKERVYEVQFVSTGENPSAFCDQDHLIPFGAECVDLDDIEPETYGQGDTVRNIFIDSEQELKMYFVQGNYLNEETLEFGFNHYDSNEAYNALLTRARAAFENTRGICVNQLEIETHYANTERLCSVQLQEQFVQDVLALPSIIEIETPNLAYQTFTQTYGQHVVTGVTLGGRALVIQETTSNGCFKLTESQLYQHPNLELFGGSQEALVNPNNRIQQWLQTLPHNPTILRREVAPITDFFDSFFFPNDQSIENQADIFYELYGGQFE